MLRAVLPHYVIRELQQFLCSTLECKKQLLLQEPLGETARDCPHYPQATKWVGDMGVRRSHWHTVKPGCCRLHPGDSSFQPLGLSTIPAKSLARAHARRCQLKVPARSGPNAMPDIIAEAATTTLDLGNRDAWRYIYEFFLSRNLTPQAANKSRAEAWQLRRKLQVARKLTAQRSATLEPSDMPDVPVELPDLLADPPKPVATKAEPPRIGFRMEGQRWGIRPL